ncbi:MAG: RsmD family RNA methyltransferase [Candidatus Marinimicrobia bacterium]|nr:RsmD family RNA methyltransferase [Candidatus Neomarinimicrobiota bacterium]
MPRIISGKHGGIKLISPKHNIRPTADRVKEYIFNVLQEFDNKVVLDLFSGIGSLGIEAYSRGAKEVFLVENNNRSIDIIKRNLSKINNPKNIKYYKSNALNFCNEYSEYFDTIFADPPYKLKLEKDFFDSIYLALKVGGIFIFENSIKNKFDIMDSLILRKEKKFGETGVWMYEKK